MNYAEKENIPGLFFIVDFEKAFDSISLDFINECLNFFNFRESKKKKKKKKKNGFHFFIMTKH